MRTARLLAAILLLVAAYETALALDWVSIGAVPGVDAPGAKTAVAIGGAAMVGGAFLLALAPTRLALLLPLGSVAVVLARYYTFDPYYAPTLRRYSNGIVSAWWLALLTVVAMAIPLSRRFAPLGAGVVLVAAGTLLVEGAGH